MVKEQKPTPDISALTSQWKEAKARKERCIDELEYAERGLSRSGQLIGLIQTEIRESYERAGVTAATCDHPESLRQAYEDSYRCGFCYVPLSEGLEDKGVDGFGQGIGD